IEETREVVGGQGGGGRQGVGVHRLAGDDRALSGDVAAGVEVAGESHLGGGLGEGEDAFGDVDVGEDTVDDVELLVDAVALDEAAGTGGDEVEVAIEDEPAVAGIEA